MNTSQSAGAVILNPKGEIAIVNQKGRSWSLPKGHVEDNEDLLEAAKREVHEETGLTELTYIKKLGSYSRFALGKDNSDNSKEFKTLHFFLFTTKEQALRPNDPDNPEARWVTKEEIEAYLTHPEDKKFIRTIITEHLLSA